MEHWGCPWSRKADGHANVRAFGGMKIERTWFAADKTGFHMLHTLFQTSIKYPSIKRFDEHFCVDLVVEDGRVQGVRGDRDRHRRVPADPGQGGDHRHRRRRPRVPREHQRRHRHRRRHGAGLPPRRAAARHGVRAVPPDLHAGHRPAVHRGLPRRRRLPAEQGRLPLPAGLRPGPGRADAAQQGDGAGPARPPEPGLLAREAEGPHDRGPARRRWCTSTCATWAKQKLRERLPQIYELADEYLGRRSGREPIPVLPAVHYTMGGILADGKTASPLPGLYSVGECSSVGIHGANRLGSNSLTELLVFGKVAGVEAARYAKTTCARQRRERCTRWPKTRASAALAHRHAPTAAPSASRRCAARWRKSMEDGCGIYRTGRDHAGHLRHARRAAGSATSACGIDDHSRAWNTEWLLAIELGYLLDVAQAMAHSALNRKESRGSHQRLDGFEQRDDVEFPQALAGLSTAALIRRASTTAP